MRGTCARQQGLAHGKKEKPCQEQTQGNFSHTDQATDSGTLGKRGTGHPFEARGTDDPVIVFRDAFTAKVSSALRTSGYCLAFAMVKAALLD